MARRETKAHDKPSATLALRAVVQVAGERSIRAISNTFAANQHAARAEARAAEGGIGNLVI